MVQVKSIGSALRIESGYQESKTSWIMGPLFFLPLHHHLRLRVLKISMTDVAGVTRPGKVGHLEWRSQKCCMQWGLCVSQGNIWLPLSEEEMTTWLDLPSRKTLWCWGEYPERVQHFMIAEIMVFEITELSLNPDATITVGKIPSE